MNEPISYHSNIITTTFRPELLVRYRQRIIVIQPIHDPLTRDACRAIAQPGARARQMKGAGITPGALLNVRRSGPSQRLVVLQAISYVAALGKTTGQHGSIFNGQLGYLLAWSIQSIATEMYRTVACTTAC